MLETSRILVVHPSEDVRQRFVRLLQSDHVIVEAWERLSGFSGDRVVERYDLVLAQELPLLPASAAHRWAQLVDTTRAAVEPSLDSIDLTLDDLQLARLVEWRAYHAKLESRLVQQLRDQAVLLELTRSLTQRRDLGEILHLVAQKLTQVIRVDRASVVLVDEDQRTGWVAAASEDPGLRQLKISLDKYPEILEVVAHGEALVVDDARSHPLLKAVRDAVAAVGVRAQLVVPLVASSRVIGVLFLRSWREQGGFTEREIALAKTAANSVAVAIEAARPQERTRGNARLRSQKAALASREPLRELIESKSLLERIIDSSRDGIIAARLDGEVLVFSKGAGRILGWKAEQVVGRRPLAKLLAPGVFDELVRQLRGRLYGGPGQLDAMRREAVAEDGELVPINVAGAMLSDEGRDGTMVLLFTDLRERLKMERKLTNAQQKVVEAEKQAVVAELAGTAAHELNQPLTSMMAYAEMLLRRIPEGDPSRRAVETLQSEAERMAEIVRKIGKITRYETKPYAGTARVIDLDKSTDR